jgi:cytochrome c oxidase subunit 1
LSFFVWQHHLFVSGINADLRPFYMLSTEIISIPTGFIFLCVMGTLWKARTSFGVPMLFVLAWTFNFLIGGLSGVFLSDTPSDTDTHGSFFVMAHFHYTIMGGLIFAFFAGVYLWVSISAFVLGLSMLIFLFNVVYSLIFVREPASANPWNSKSLEFQVPTPVPVNNFEQIPVFDSDPYDYGIPISAGSGQPAAAGA